MKKITNDDVVIKLIVVCNATNNYLLTKFNVSNKRANKLRDLIQYVKYCIDIANRIE